MHIIYLIGEQALSVLTPPNGTMLVHFPVEEWNRELTPWPAPALHGREPFTGEAEAFLQKLLGFITTFEEQNGSPTTRSICGYSLAGAFAIWSLTRCDSFDSVASVSGSLWYDGMMDYLSQQPFQKKPTYVYLSLGEAEKKTRDPRMSQVEKCTLILSHLLQQRGIPYDFHLVPGGHFYHPEQRLQHAIDQLAAAENK